MENCLKIIQSTYCCVNNRFVTITKGVVKYLKYQNITDWPSVTGTTNCSYFSKWFENKEKALLLKHLLTNYFIISDETRSNVKQSIFTYKTMRLYMFLYISFIYAVSYLGFYQ